MSPEGPESWRERPARGAFGGGTSAHDPANEDFFVFLGRLAVAGRVRGARHLRGAIDETSRDEIKRRLRGLLDAIEQAYGDEVR